MKTTAKNNNNVSLIYEAAEHYLQRGLSVIPIKERDKKPIKGYKWKEDSLTLETVRERLSSVGNIGIALGERSGGLVDLDFDMRETTIMGQKLFPHLPSFGRQSSPCSHRITVCRSPEKTKQFSLSTEEVRVLGIETDEKSMVLEVRSSGGYTVFPPSVHPSGERIGWHNGMLEDIPESDWDDLLRWSGICAFLAIILKMYPESAGIRDKVCLALAGTLLRADLTPDMVDGLIIYIAEQKGDEEAHMRGKAHPTQERLEAGEEVMGLPTLCEILAIQALEKKLRKWLYGDQSPEDPEKYIHELNKALFVVENEGTKCVVAFFDKRFFEKGQTRDVMVTQAFPDFRKRFMNKFVQVGINKNGGPIMKALGDFWLEHPKRREYFRIDFLSGQEAPEGIYNLWQGFAYEPKEGSWQHMDDHIRRVLAQNSDEAYDYIIRWAAWAIQNPGEPAEVALVFRGGKGAGKGTFCRWIKNLFGQHGLQIFSSQHITGRFNGHLRDCVLLFADEAIAPNDRDAEAILKGFLTEPTVPVERKGQDVIMSPNHLHVVMASNADWVIPASADERRFAMFDISDEMAQNRDWFSTINTEMENGGAEAMLHSLLNYDLGGWHPRDDIPANDALTEQRIQSLRRAERLWFDYLYEGDIPEEIMEERSFIITTRFSELAGITATAAGRFLERMGCEKGRGMARGWIPPSVPEARKIWDREVFAVRWPSWSEPADPPF